MTWPIDVYQTRIDQIMTERRFRLDISYDGTHFHGWAIQPGLRTVEGELADWITRISGLTQPVRLVVAGRTDAGVHARGQVAHVDLAADWEPTKLLHRLARVLPPDIVVRRVIVAPAGFDARFAAIWRRYVYRLWDAASHPDPLLRGMTTQVKAAIDTELMTEAGRRLLGLHDFAPFCKYRPGATTIRTLLECQARRISDGQGTIELMVRADAFCHSMVRSLTGALVAVGSGVRPLDWIDEVAACTTRHGSVKVMPAAGLCLEQVAYPPDVALTARVHTARAVRSLPDNQGTAVSGDCGCGAEG